MKLVLFLLYCVAKLSYYTVYSSVQNRKLESMSMFYTSKLHIALPSNNCAGFFFLPGPGEEGEAIIVQYSIYL